jgi:hypothetical protein
MSWKKLQAEGRVRTHKTSKKELNELRALIARDLEDAAIQALLDDRRFATAYNAALQAFVEPTNNSVRIIHKIE